MLNALDPIAARLLSKSRPEGDCLVWFASLTTSGYGQLKVGRGPAYAHRLAWESTFGPIPDGMFVCHQCDNKRCINPSHLFLGSPADNVRDMIAKKRSAVGEKHGCSRLTEAEVIEIRRLYATGEHFQEEIADQFGVSSAHVCGIIKHKFWKHLPALPKEES